MALPPTPDNLTAILAHLANKLDSLKKQLDHIEALAGPMITSVGFTTDSPMAFNSPPIIAHPTKGKWKAKAFHFSLTAPQAKKKQPIKNIATLSTTVPPPLAQTFSTEGKADFHHVMVVIPDATAQHIIGQGSKGLKQVHDISGTRISAYVLAAGPSDKRHISICGTETQIGDALVVLGKRITRKRVRPPKVRRLDPR